MAAFDFDGGVLAVSYTHLDVYKRQIKSITVKNIGSDTKVDAMLSGDIDLAQGPDATALNRVENNDDINIVKVTGTRENDFERCV